MMKGAQVVNWKLDLLIALILIIIFLLVWTGAAGEIIKYLKAHIQFSVQTCEQLGATVSDPNAPGGKRCL